MVKKGYIEVNGEKELAQRCIPLGEDDCVVVGEVEEVIPMTTEERVIALEQRLYELTNSVDSMFSIIKKLLQNENRSKRLAVNTKDVEKNKQEIPIDTVLIAKHHNANFYLCVKEDGFYVGENKYSSLSAAAEGVTGSRRSGLVFWYTQDGRTVKKAYKDG